MEQTLSAVYEHGSLRLLDPVDLAESSPVQVQILPPKGDFRTLAFKRQLARTQELLLTYEKEQESDLVRRVFLQILQTDLHTLWHLMQPPRRMLCTMLLLSARHLQPDTISPEQIAAIRFVLDRLATPTFAETDIDLCRERLISAGLPSSFAFPPAVIQSYLDEL